MWCLARRRDPVPHHRVTMSARTVNLASGSGLRARAVEQLSALHAITRASAAADSDDDLLRYTAGAARRALQAASVSIERFEREQGLLRALVNDGELGPDEVPLPDDDTYAISDYAALGRLEQGARGVVTHRNDPDADPAEVALLRSLGKHSALQVPIVLDGAVWGELYASRNADVAAFTESDLEFAEAVAAQVASGIAQGVYARRLEAMVSIDALTGLASRSAVEDRLEAALDGFLQSARVVSVMVCDLNGLKAVNDERGHASGDRLLTRVGELLSLAAAELPGSLVGRLGGDEFCLVVSGCPVDQVLRVGGELCRRAALLPAGQGLSCGIASTADPIGHVGTPGDLLRLADAAQYRAKRSRAARPVVAGRPLDPEVAAALSGPPLTGRDVGRRGADLSLGLLTEVLELLDGCRGASAADRLSAVGDAVCREADAAGWWLSVASATDCVVRSLRFGATRVAEEPAQAAVAADRQARFFDLDVTYDLAEYAATAQAITGGWFAQRVDDPDGDVAERALLQENGYTQMVAAGGVGGRQRWLLEIYADDVGRSVAELGPCLRLLVTQALADAGDGAGEPADAQPAVRR